MHPDLKPGALSSEQLGECLRGTFPISSSDGAMVVEFVEPEELEDGGLRGKFRVISWGIDGEDRSLRGIKEQEVFLLTIGMRNEPDRVRTFFRALARVLPDLLGTENAEELMPHELINTEPLSLRRAETEEDFEKALRAKDRLGKWL